MGLNEKEKLFAKEYVINKGNAYQAALKAGYKVKTAKTAYEWLLETLPNPTAKRHLPYKAELAAEIQAQFDKIHSEKSADAKEVIEFLTAIMRGEETEQTLRLVGDGVQRIDDIEVSAKERLKAAELLGKTLQMFTDKLNVDGDMDYSIKIDYGGEDE
jgi:phage terminase small subunit